MPALPSVPKVLKVVWGFQIGEDLGAICRNFWQYTGAGASGSDLTTFASAVGDAFPVGLMTADRILETVQVTDLTSPTSPEVTAIIALAGTNADTKLPASASFVISNEIGRRYRGGHPRNYWPLGGEADLADAQTWNTDFITAVSTAWAAYLASIEGAIVPGITTIAPVNVGYYHGFTVHTGTTGRARNVPTPLAVPFVDPITGQDYRTGLGQQRRRLLHLA